MKKLFIAMAAIMGVSAANAGLVMLPSDPVASACWDKLKAENLCESERASGVMVAYDAARECGIGLGIQECVDAPSLSSVAREVDG